MDLWRCVSGIQSTSNKFSLATVIFLTKVNGVNLILNSYVWLNAKCLFFATYTTYSVGFADEIIFRHLNMPELLFSLQMKLWKVMQDCKWEYASKYRDMNDNGFSTQEHTCTFLLYFSVVYLVLVTVLTVNKFIYVVTWRRDWSKYLGTENILRSIVLPKFGNMELKE